MLPRLTAVLLLAALAPLTAQQPDPFRLLQTLQIEGNQTFSRAAIVAGLAGDRSMMLWMHEEGLSADTCKQVVDRVRAGYLAAGFPTVEVEGKVAGAGIALTVLEGARRRCGAVRITGNKAVDGQELVAAIANADGRWRGWRVDSFSRCNEETAAEVRSRLVACYRKVGRHGIRLSTQFAPKADRVDFVVKIADEGTEVHVGSVAIAGERDDDRAAVLASLQVPADALFTSDLAIALRRQLESLGRYASVRVPLPDEGVPRLEPLTVTVKLLADTPAMAAMSQRDVTQLDGAMHSLLDQIAAGKTVLAHVASPTLRFAGCSLDGPFEVQLGRRGARVRCASLRTPDGKVAPAEVLLADGELTLDLGGATYGQATGGPKITPVQVFTAAGDDGFALHWRLGLFGLEHLEATNPRNFGLHPATAAHLLYGGVAVVSRDGDDLKLQIGDTAITVDGKGGVRPLPLRLGEGSDIAVVDTDVDAMVAAANAARKDRRTVALGAFVAGWLADQLATVCEAAERDRCRQLLRIGLMQIAAPDPAPKTAAPDFVVPPLGIGEPSDADQFRQLLHPVAMVLPADSWATNLVAGLDAVISGDAAGLAAVQQIGAAPQHGPLACLLGAALLQYAGRDEPAQRLRERGRERCNVDAACADLMALAPAGSDGERRLRRVGAAWHAEPALAALFSNLQDEDKDLAACRRGLQALWQGGFGKCLADALADTRR